MTAEKGPGAASGRDLGTDPRRGLGSAPGRGLGSAPGRGLGSDPGRALGSEPERDPGSQPGRGLGSDPGRGLGSDPGRALGSEPERDPGSAPGRGLGSDPGRDLGSEPERDPGSDPGRALGTEPGRDPGSQPGRDLGSEPERDPGAASGRALGSEPERDPGSDPGWGPRTAPEQGLGTALELTTYRGYDLDEFQRRAIALVHKNESVLVSAPTGTGKTLVADYLIEEMARRGLRVVYTAPIKALSNQKFKEFKRLLGEDRVGILTGDVVINPEAPVLIMTTEIFRNLLHQDPARVEDVAYCIFDEIHYIDDPHRGSVWEESLIFMPPTMRFLGLSATIPNVEELAQWLTQVHGHEVHVVYHPERAVPLKHYLYEQTSGITSLRALTRRYERYARRLRVRNNGRLKLDFPRTTHIDLIKEIHKNYLPCLFFTFSRRRCEVHAVELGERFDFATGPEKAKILEVVEHHLARYGDRTVSKLPQLKWLLSRGIGYHHAGLMPVVKDIVEDLFEQRLLKVLYCTETFAVGLNFPCRTVCFEAVTKWDGETFRPLSNREYFQMAGRAGRRGIDNEGFAFALADFNYFVPSEFPSMQEDDVEPLQSRFAVSYNTVLNLVRTYDDEEIKAILRKNFATYQGERERERLESALANARIRLKTLEEAESGGQPLRRARRRVRQLERDLQEMTPAERYAMEFATKRLLLEELDFIRDGRLTARGEFAAMINIQELLVTELFFAGWFHELDEDSINALVVSIDYEPRKSEGIHPHDAFDRKEAERIARALQDREMRVVGYAQTRFQDHVAQLAYRWSKGEAFARLLRGAYQDEGDIVYTFRRGIDLLRQLRFAAGEDASLRAKLQECIDRMDRDEVSIVL